jgi:hypothetical protein
MEILEQQTLVVAVEVVDKMEVVVVVAQES